MITKPGTYLARNGETVIIDKIGERGTTPCQGRCSRTATSGKVRWVHNLWRRDGRLFPIREHGEDVVGAR